MPKRAILPVASFIVISLVYYGSINNQKKLASDKVKDKHLEFIRKRLKVLNAKDIPPDSIDYYNGYKMCLSNLTDSLIVDIDKK